jgi:hypothetical protein
MENAAAIVLIVMGLLALAAILFFMWRMRGGG